jgi:replicative DNA helicase
MTPPNDLEAERSVLGGLLLGADPADVAGVFITLQPESFYRRAHAVIFAACHALHQGQVEIDEVTVTTKLRELGTLDDAGGTAAVAELTEATPTTANLPEYARIVRERWMRRRLIAASVAAQKAALELDTPIADVLDRVAENVSHIATAQSRGEIHTMSQLVRSTFDDLQKRAAEGDESTGVPTGFVDLDAKLGGLQRGEFIILAGRPSMGKTAMATAFAENAAIRGEVSTLVISLEMHREALVMRSLSAQARVDGQKLRRPAKLESDEWSRIVEACAQLDTQKLHVVDTANLTVLEIRALARITQARHGLGLLVVDYLGLIRPVNRYPNAREREVAEISAGLKSLAKELGIPVLCLAQLNRGLEQRDNKRPRLSDLRESGSLEQDADVVMFVHREGYYDSKAADDVAEVIIAKQRNGPIGVVNVGWEARCSKFFNLNRGLF